MSSFEQSARRNCRQLAGAALLAGMLAGCFQPMYADRSLTGGTGPNLREAMRDVEIAKIDGRVGQEIRNDIIFELSGGGGNPTGAPHSLNLQRGCRAGCPGSPCAPAKSTASSPAPIRDAPSF